MDIPESGPGSLAGIGARALARVGDFFLSIVFPFFVLTTFFAERGEDEEGNVVIEAIPVEIIFAAIVIYAAYEIGFVAWKGRTIGMMSGRLRLQTFDRDVAVGTVGAEDDPTAGGSSDDFPAGDRSPRGTGDEGGISLAVAVRRGLPGVLLFIAAQFGLLFALMYVFLYLSPVLDPLYKQGWHDKLAGTIVVQAPPRGD
jgi:uncharacterized RDD family membrane protein YckC